MSSHDTLLTRDTALGRRASLVPARLRLRRDSNRQSRSPQALPDRHNRFVTPYPPTPTPKLTRHQGMFLSFICWTITCAVYENSNETNASAGYAQIPFVWIYGVCYALAWSGLLIAYALEVLPYSLRAKGLTIMNITVQAILAVGGQTNPVAWDNLPHHWNLALFFTVSRLLSPPLTKTSPSLKPKHTHHNIYSDPTQNSSGSASNSSGSSSCTRRPKARRSRKSAASSTAPTPSPTSTWQRSSRRSRSAMSPTRRARMLLRAASESRFCFLYSVVVVFWVAGVIGDATLRGEEGRGCHTCCLDACLLVIICLDDDDDDCLVCWNRDCRCEVGGWSCFGSFESGLRPSCDVILLRKKCGPRVGASSHAVASWGQTC
jgi:hypothetical protein